MFLANGWKWYPRLIYPFKMVDLSVMSTFTKEAKSRPPSHRLAPPSCEERRTVGIAPPETARHGFAGIDGMFLGRNSVAHQKTVKKRWFEWRLHEDMDITYENI
jgi:hypothetical protein